jgi:DNA-binding transcriptional regulator YiaG
MLSFANHNEPVRIGKNMSGDALQCVLQELAMSTKQLSELCGVTRSTVWKWRTGASPVPIYAQTILRQKRVILRLGEMAAVSGRAATR